MGIKRKRDFPLDKPEVECFCGAKAVLIRHDMHVSWLGETLKNLGAYRCHNCGREFSTSAQMRELDRLLNQKMKIKAQS